MHADRVQEAAEDSLRARGWCLSCEESSDSHPCADTLCLGQNPSISCWVRECRCWNCSSRRMSDYCCLILEASTGSERGKVRCQTLVLMRQLRGPRAFLSFPASRDPRFDIDVSRQRARISHPDGSRPSGCRLASITSKRQQLDKQPQDQRWTERSNVVPLMT